MRRGSTKKKLISICIPVLNEEKNIEKLYSELKSLAKKVDNNYIFEFILCYVPATLTQLLPL